jgi:hypothetical protein
MSESRLYIRILKNKQENFIDYVLADSLDSAYNMSTCFDVVRVHASDSYIHFASELEYLYGITNGTESEGLRVKQRQKVRKIYDSITNQTNLSASKYSL